jgi:hypothetical protein
VAQLPGRTSCCFILPSLTLLVLMKRALLISLTRKKLTHLNPGLLSTSKFKVAFSYTFRDQVPQFTSFKFAHFTISISAYGSHFFLWRIDVMEITRWPLPTTFGKLASLMPSSFDYMF